MAVHGRACPRLCVDVDPNIILRFMLLYCVDPLSILRRRGADLVLISPLSIISLTVSHAFLR